MKISHPKLIANLYEWLPGHGESRVTFQSEGMNVYLRVEYEVETASERDAGGWHVDRLARDIVFASVRSFIKLPFPSVGLFEFIGDSKEFVLGRLTEFEKSELLENILKSWRVATTSSEPIIASLQYTIFVGKRSV